MLISRLNVGEIEDIRGRLYLEFDNDPKIILRFREKSKNPLKLGSIRSYLLAEYFRDQFTYVEKHKYGAMKEYLMKRDEEV